MKSGIDVFTEKGLIDKIKSKKIGLLIHAASVNRELIHICQIFRDKGIKVEFIFTPEHGLYGEAQDMEAVEDSTYEYYTKAPVISLYGKSKDSLYPERNLVKECDIIIVDLQDVGARYYTYVWTIYNFLEVCLSTGTELWILDRVNPINGVNVEGPILKRKFFSFVGKGEIPIRHGLTIGEIIYNLSTKEKKEWQQLLKIIKLEGWHREYYFDETGLSWVMPSPNMPSLNTALVYPGSCLIEATILSEGRGTTRPFEIIGAPFIRMDWAQFLNNQGLPGVIFRAIRFKPKFNKYKDQVCNGIFIHVTDRNKFLPVTTGIVILWSLFQQKYNQTEYLWREEPYEFETEIAPITMLTGDILWKELIEDPSVHWKDIVNLWKKDELYFLENRAVLY